MKSLLVRWTKVAPVGAAFVVLCLSGCGGDAPGETSSGPSMWQHQGETQGTTYLVKYLSEEPVAQTGIDSILAEVDQAANLWMPESIISRVNAWDREDTVFSFRDDSFVFTSLWLQSEEIHRMTDGAFDPTVLPLVELWGFGLSERGEVTPEQVEQVRQWVGLQNGVMDLNPVEEAYQIVRTDIRKRYKEAKLDFNSIAQGFTVDLILEWLLDAGIQNAMVEIGGEVRCAGLNDRGEPWHIAIDQPLFTGVEDRQLEAIVALSDRAVCTSGSYRKFYEEDGVKRSHTIDPTTGYPVDHGLLSATIRAKSAARADALATACMVMGFDRAREFIADYQRDFPEEGLEAVLLVAKEGGGWRTWVTHGWGDTLIPLRESGS